ncbi:MAG: UvrD-helicase domain-containing protein [Oceanibaculum nanhaiense]|uniref:ATP-dependent helicase n=1 Tax=Oceanibaculum nanhaiense TaxID=1909734 RepID=UPI0025A3A111|nr:UvrD-helicase domain-containing protein [Oceanibaculum nanhaiense]MDM7947251.1 UvrD-helicase domain-containing protein [Oceanibaculum nanhaiense]
MSMTTPSSPDFRPAASRPAYLDTLNAAQRQAVETLDGPVLVLAGAGTGKTRVLITRLAHLLVTGRAKPWNILAVTFTNKAAREMRERIAAIIGPAAEQIWLGTFHAICVRILRRHAELVGLKSNFTILDADDQVRLLKQLLQAEGIDDKRWPARVLMGTIQRWKDRALSPDRVPAEDAMELAGGKIVQLYRQYQERLLTLNAADFGDLMLHCVELFQKHPEVLAEYHDRFSYMLVDEYQDTNVAQYLWLRLLAQTNKNICCVGDDDQSIYGWRGAEVGNILKFEKDFPGAAVIRLEQNYRSTPHILAAAGGLIAKNEGRLGKTLWTEANEGEKVRVRGVWDGEEEARTVGEEVEALQRAGNSLAEMAVLVRAGFQTREFEERFITLGVPYRVVGGPRFYERLEIRDAIAYLRIIAQPDDDLAFERIVNTPRRGLGDATLQAAHQLARAQGTSLMTACRQLVGTDELKPKPRKSLSDLIRDFDRWRAELTRMPHPDLAQLVLDESGYTAMWQLDKSPEAPGRLENLKELIRAMEEFESLAGFLEHISLVMENAEDSSLDQLSIMTLHSAKGLEFDTVFLPGWEEGLFPHQRALDESGASGLEEERRLAYVGLTRARKRADILYAANRRVHGLWQNSLPSRFVSELPADHVEQDVEGGLFGGGARQTDWGAASRSGAYASSPPRESGGYFEGGRRFARREQPTLEGVPYSVATNKPNADGVKRGTRVFHQKFGMGTVRSVEADKLEIEFDKAGTKKVLAAFVEKK